MNKEISHPEQSDTQEGVIVRIHSGEYFGIEPKDKKFAIFMFGMDCNATFVRMELPKEHNIKEYAPVIIKKVTSPIPESNETVDTYTLTSLPEMPEQFEITSVGIDWRM